MFIRTSLPIIKRPKRSFRPDFIAPSVADIDFKVLESRGIKACFIDLDGTVVARGTFEVDKKIAKQLKASGLPIYIATNRPRGRKLNNLEIDLSANGVVHPTKIFAKPTKRYYKHGLTAHGLKPYEVVMIGDRYIQDMFGANRAGLYTLLVFKLGKPIGKFDALLSKLELKATKLFTRRYTEV